jgi:hypothetical protein
VSKKPIDTQITLMMLNEQLKHISEFVEGIKTAQIALHDMVCGNSNAGLVDDMRDIKRILKGDGTPSDPGILVEFRKTREQLSELARQFNYAIKVATWTVRVAGVVATAIVTVAVTNAAENVLNSPTDDGAQHAIDTATPVALSEPTPVAQSMIIPTTATPFPNPPTLTPTPISVTDNEMTALSALCWVECRGMEDKRADCCASVLSTVFERARQRQMSDGTILGTLRYGCRADTVACQFPAYVANGCEGIVSPCPFDDKKGMGHFEYIVRRYLRHSLVAPCEKYLFYDLWTSGRKICTVESDNGQFLIFHNNDEPQIERLP